jgi:hypothetical protein
MPKYEFETGEKLTFLGLVFLILKYLLPVIIGIFLIIVFFLAIKYLLSQIGLTVSTPEEIFYALIMAGLIAILLIVR